MRLPKFELLHPTSIEEAADLLNKHGSSAKIAAGGSDIFPRMKYGLEFPKSIISLSKIPAAQPSYFDDGLITIDGLTTLADIVKSDLIRKTAYCLSEAAHCVGSNQIRHMGTIAGNLCIETRCLYYNQKHSYQFIEPCFKRGGSLCYFIPKGKKCWAVFMADTAPALLSLDATVKIVSSGVSKRIPIEELYTGDSIRPLALSDNELLTAIMIPVRNRFRGTAFMKFTLRGGLEFAAINTAVVVDMEQDGKTCANIKIVVGAVSPAPIRLYKTESMLAKKELSEDLINSAADAAAKEIRPIPHHGFSASYLKACARTLVRDAIATAYKRSQDNVTF